MNDDDYTPDQLKLVKEAIVFRSGEIFATRMNCPGSLPLNSSGCYGVCLGSKGLSTYGIKTPCELYQCVINIDRREDLEKILPHRKNALMIDGLYYDQGNENIIKAFKTVKNFDPFLDGHFPCNPMLPGYCQIELVNLAAASLIKLKSNGKMGNIATVVREVSGVKYKEVIRPEDRLSIIVKLNQTRGNKLFVFSGEITNQANERVMTVEKVTGLAI